MYTIYWAITSCDKEWEYLGEVQADSEEKALEEAAKQWTEYPSVELVALATAEVAVSV